MRKWIPLGVTLIAIALVGCDPNRELRESLQSEIFRLESLLRIESEAVGGGRSKVASLEKLLYEQQAALRAFEAQFEAYLMNHKMAVAAIALGAAGGTVALDPQNEFSDDARQIGAVVGVIALVWAAANAAEIAEVVDQMIQADSLVKSLQAQIAATKTALTDERTVLQGAEERFASIEQAMTRLHTELSSLGD